DAHSNGHGASGPHYQRDWLFPTERANFASCRQRPDVPGQDVVNSNLQAGDIYGRDRHLSRDLVPSQPARHLFRAPQCPTTGRVSERAPTMTYHASFGFILDYWSALLADLSTTLELTGVCVVLGVLLGFVLSLMRTSESTVIYVVSSVY